jgi:hypothetical protein
MNVSMIWGEPQPKHLSIQRITKYTWLDLFFFNNDGGHFLLLATSMADRWFETIYKEKLSHNFNMEP